MTESLKEKADKLFRTNPPPTRVIPIEEMQRSINESREKLQSGEKGSKRKTSSGEKIAEKFEKPCPKCGVAHWNVFPDGRKYCLKCGNVEEPEKIICEFKCDKCGVAIEIQGKDIEAAKKITFPHKEHDPSAQCDGAFQFEKQVKSTISDKGGKNLEKILVDFKCNKCDVVVSFQVPSIEVAMKKTVLHKKYNPKAECDGTLALFMQAIPNLENIPIPETKKTEKQSTELEGGNRIKGKFKHPKLGKSFCGNCYNKDDCLQTYYHQHICLLNSIDLKLKKLVDRLQY